MQPNNRFPTSPGPSMPHQNFTREELQWMERQQAGPRGDISPWGQSNMPVSEQMPNNLRMQMTMREEEEMRLRNFPIPDQIPTNQRMQMAMREEEELRIRNLPDPMPMKHRRQMMMREEEEMRMRNFADQTPMNKRMEMSLREEDMRLLQREQQFFEDNFTQQMPRFDPLDDRPVNPEINHPMFPNDMPNPDIVWRDNSNSR